MEQDFKIKKEGTTLTVELGIELTARNVPTLVEELLKYYGQDIEKVVFDATGLAYLTKESLQAVYYADKRLGNEPEIIFVNCEPEIRKVLDYIDVSKHIKFEERLDARKNFRREKLKNVDATTLGEIAKERRDLIEKFEAHNDLVCYNMKPEQEDD